MLHLQSIRSFTSLGSGTEESTLDGNGIEFSGIREYSDQDDARMIAWRSSAKGDTTYIKKYTTTTSLRISLFADTYRSTHFRSKEHTLSKYEMQKKIIKGIYHSAKVFGHQIDPLIIGAAGLEKISSSSLIEKEMTQLSWMQSLMLSDAFGEKIFENCKRLKIHDSLIIIICDLLHPPKPGILAELRRSNDVILIHLFDAFEINPTSDIIISDGAKSGYIHNSEIPTYQKEFEKERKKIESHFLGEKSYLMISTTDALEEKWNHFFLSRK